MGVIFRTGEHTAASVSWPVYLFLVLPVQMLFAVIKGAIVAARWLVITVIAVASFVIGRLRHEESRPPAA